jgi:hypothetical protein
MLCWHVGTERPGDAGVLERSHKAGELDSAILKQKTFVGIWPLVK